MALDRITLSHFRNHEESMLDGSARFNLLIGENGAGKTNVLEALSLFAPGRGLRRAPLVDMAMKPAPGTDQASEIGGFAVSALLDCGDGSDPVRLGTGARGDKPGRRLVQINGADSSAMALGEWLAISWLTPAMDGLFTDSAGVRRRYLDRLTLALDPGHAQRATRYETALRERNRLLDGDADPDPAWMDAIEAQLAEHGATLCAGRVMLVERLNQALETLPDQPFARPVLSYVSGGPTNEADLADDLRRNRQRDRAARRTLSGPHRDELNVAMAGKGLPASACSTGEQKAMLIAITLAHARLAARGRPGILLLDEVAAHLDPIRRGALFDRLGDTGTQVWMTGTEMPPFEAIRDEAAIWYVNGGAVQKAA